MKKTLLYIAGFSLSVAVFALPAAAAENDVIRIIREDGSVTEYKIPENMPAAPAEKKEAPRPQKKEAVGKKQSPSPAAPVKKVEQKAPVKKTAVKKAAAPQERGFLVPGRKPSVPHRMTIKNMPEGSVISSDDALRIALDIAPPARRIQTSREMYQDKRVYVFTFITEDGAKDIMVDAQNGEIIRP